MTSQRVTACVGCTFAASEFAKATDCQLRVCFISYVLYGIEHGADLGFGLGLGDVRVQVVVAADEVLQGVFVHLGFSVGWVVVR